MEQFPHHKERRKPEKVSEDYWFEIGRELYEKLGKIPDPIEIRAAALIKAIGLPEGPYSAIEIDPKTKRRVNPEKDRIITEYLTNHPGVEVAPGVVSLDFRDMYPDGLPEELKNALDPATREIMEIEYEHQKRSKENYERTKDKHDLDAPVHYFRLPGGIDLFLRGYRHNPRWQVRHGEYLKKLNKLATVIAIEGIAQRPFGKSLDLYWSSLNHQRGHYDALMKEAVESGFSGLFTEVDARDISKVRMDHDFASNRKVRYPELPDEFYQDYFEYLKRKHPSLTKIIDSPEELKAFLMLQSLVSIRRRMRGRDVVEEGKIYYLYPYLTETRRVSYQPTFLELGQMLFTDALAAIKLLLIAKLMSDGYLEKGPIIDYEGARHLSSKSFFLKYPHYAMIVVLRTINELMAGRVSNLPAIYEVFRNPNWAEIVKEIARLVFKKPEKDESKPVRIGPNQRRLLDYQVDFLNIYGLNPESIMPTDEEIERIRERLKNLQGSKSES